MYGHHQNWRARGLANNLAGRIQAVHFRHLQIDNYEIRLGFPEMFDGLSAVSCLVTYPPIVLMLEQSPKALAYGRIIVCHEDADQSESPLSLVLCFALSVARSAPLVGDYRLVENANNTLQTLLINNIAELGRV